MLYKKRGEAALSPELFASPTAEYRGAPFWAWNNKLEERELLRQIDIFKEMGLGGFHIHSRSGLATPYMGDEFMRLVAACNQKAIENEMLCFLYDEDRWPSGAAGGVITKDYENRLKFLVFSPYGHSTAGGGATSTARYVPSGIKKRLARYRVRLENGFLAEYERLPPDAVPENPDGVFDAHLEIAGNSFWFNNQAYVDTLSKKAIDRFIEVTHEKYHELLWPHFGKSVPSIFTDEPQFSHKETLTHSDAKQALTLPFTDDFDETYLKTYGESFLDCLPEIIWETGRPSKTRYRYHDHVCERFTRAFADNIGAWCEAKGIMLTGHMMHEESLTSQTSALGETMRAYRSFQLPGIDMLCDRREFSTAKQAQSAARQYGREGVLSELYGVTNWDFDFRGHKLQGDWQAALGVTLRVHHLTWVSMAGEAKRDYPASIGEQSPWYKEYSYVEGHFARLNTALVRGKAITRVAVIHPIEGFWMNFWPNDKTYGIRAEMEADFENMINWLLFGHIDFDFAAESLLPELYRECPGKFVLGQMEYDAVLVPNCRSLRSTTVQALARFRDGGGAVIFAGEMPGIVDGGKAVPGMFDGFASVPFAKTAVLNALEDFRDINIRRGDGSRAEHLIYQLRQDGGGQWLFICNGTKPANQDIPKAEHITIGIKGRFSPELYDTLDGGIYPLAAEFSGDMTIIKREMHTHDSLLIRLTPVCAGLLPAEVLADGSIGCTSYNRPLSETPSVIRLKPYGFELHEPNVLVLDMAEYAFDGGEWHEADELLRIDNKFREKLGFPLRGNSWAQPWVSDEKDEARNTLALRFKFASEIALGPDEVFLALEDLERVNITFNGRPVEKTPVGYYADRSIRKIRLPGLVIGYNELLLEAAFSKTINIENCFILGRFGVEVRGQRAFIKEYPESLPFGDIVPMGLPFYGGNVTYKCKVHTKGGAARLEATYFRCPLISVKLNDEPAGHIAYSPYVLDLGILPEGRHDIEITAYGNRVNTFGALHCANETLKWFGPDAWRTTGAAWAYEYRLKPTGLLKAPLLNILYLGD